MGRRDFSNRLTRPFSTLASSDGAGSVYNFNLDYSSTPGYAELRPGVGTWVITRCLFHYTDSGNFAAGGFGSSSALTNGIEYQLVTGSGASATTVRSLTDSNFTIKSNIHWGAYCYDQDYVSFGSGDNGMNVRWSTDRFSDGLVIFSDKSYAARILLQDDLTFLTSFRIIFQGFTDVESSFGDF